MSSEFTSRARRYELQVPVRYRAVGQKDWLNGTTENISASGVLFLAERPLEPNTAIEITVVLPPGMSGSNVQVNVVCSGRVIRAAQPPVPNRQLALAAAIAEHRFLRGDLEGEA